MLYYNINNIIMNAFFSKYIQRFMLYLIYNLVFNLKGVELTVLT